MCEGNPGPPKGGAQEVGRFDERHPQEQKQRSRDSRDFSGTIPETSQARSPRTGWNSVYSRNYLYCCLLLSEAVDLSLGGSKGLGHKPVLRGRRTCRVRCGAAV